jgi:hypothetical protein
MPKRKKPPTKAVNPLDKVWLKRGRGRPVRVSHAEIVGRADNYREILDQLWDGLWPLLSKAQTDQEVIDAFEANPTMQTREFVPNHANLIRTAMHERAFPKRREGQIRFLADSIAGLGYISPRTSRDICEKKRSRARGAYHIIRYEVYVECSCGYKGGSWNHACRKCGAKVDFELYPTCDGFQLR